MGGTCQVRLLGGFAVEVDSVPLPSSAWRSEGAAQLVKLLALAPSHHLTRTDVIAQLWPMLSPRDADAHLKRAVKDSRKTLRDDRAVTVEGDRLRLWPHGELRVDVHTFAATAKHARLPEQRRAATALYRGDLLPEDRAPWADPLRTRLRLVHLELLRDPDSGTPAWIDLRTPVFTPVLATKDG